MSDRLHYSPQAQLDLDEIFDYFADELDNPEKGASVISGILAAARKIPGHAMRFPPVGPLPFAEDEYRFSQGKLEVMLSSSVRKARLCLSIASFAIVAITPPCWASRKVEEDK